MRRMSVDLPHPLGPMSETNSPAATVRSIASSACTWPVRVSNTLSTPRTSTARRSGSEPGGGGAAVGRSALRVAWAWGSLMRPPPFVGSS